MSNGTPMQPDRVRSPRVSRRSADPGAPTFLTAQPHDFAEITASLAKREALDL